MIFANTIVAATFPALSEASFLGVAAIFATGYCALAIIAGGSLRLTLAESLALSVGLAVLIVGVVALVLSVAQIPITDIAVDIPGVPLGFFAVFQAAATRRIRSSFGYHLRQILDFSDYRPAERIVMATLFVVVLIVLGIFISLTMVSLPSTQSPALAIVGPDGTPASLPTSCSRGVVKFFNVTVMGGTSGGTFVLRIRLTGQNVTQQAFQSAPFTVLPWDMPLPLSPFTESRTGVMVSLDGSWNDTVSFVIITQGSYYLWIDLLSSTSIVVASNRFPIFVGM